MKGTSMINKNRFAWLALAIVSLLVGTTAFCQWTGAAQAQLGGAKKKKAAKHRSVTIDC